MPTKRAWLSVAILTIAILLLTANATQAYDWPQFNFDNQHSGNDSAETLITINNVANLRPVFRVHLPAKVAGAPVYLDRSAAGSSDLLYVTTEDGSTLALDARSGAQVWAQQPVSGPQFTTSSPALDPSGAYVYSYGLDGYVHKYASASGTELIGSGWPETVTLKPDVEKESSSLAIATNVSGTVYLYATTAGYPLPEPGDAGDYQGHITTINLSTGSQSVFNSLCSDLTVHFVESGTIGFNDCGQTRSGIWARPGVVYDPDTDRIYITTGNGDYSGNTGGYDWGDSILALNPDGSSVNGVPLDSYTPSNYQQLQGQDLDVGSSNLAIVPSPAGSSYAHIGVQTGKEGKIYLIDLDDMSGQGGPGYTGGELERIDIPQSYGVLPSPAIWTNPADGSGWLFYANDLGISGTRIRLNGATPILVPRWVNYSGGTSPIIANGVLYYAHNGEIQALDPTSGGLLWSDNSIGNIHWQSPMVANGVLYIADESAQLTAYALAATTPTPTVSGTPPTATPTRTPLDTPLPPSATPTHPTDTATSTPTPAPTHTSTSTPTPAPTHTSTSTPTPAPTQSATSTLTPAPTNTPTSLTQIPTNTPTSLLTQTPTSTLTPCADPFVDLAGNPFRPAIDSLYCGGVVSGADPTHYLPTAPASRSQFAKMVVVGFGLAISTPPAGPTFSDVPPSYYAYAYIESGYAAGILSGFDPSSCAAAGVAYPCYLPNLAITRGQLARLVVNAAGYPLTTPSGGQTFSDVPPQNTFFAYIETAYQHGVVNGYPDRRFRPNVAVRRDEMAQIVYTAIRTPASRRHI